MCRQLTNSFRLTLIAWHFGKTVTQQAELGLGLLLHEGVRPKAELWQLSRRPIDIVILHELIY